ncbi:MAG: LacI family DNA-binding transcriptional regulator [Alphaproteobacteria bacterium]|nr:LacI family DNA-binding transcriptional regulator [Alphaproteobacteria bacterium]
MSIVARNKNSKPRVTVKDLARDLGMSVSTVSRAFHADAVIAKDTRDVVLNRAREIGYSPNPFARSLITKKTRIVGVVVADITNPFYPEVLTRLTTELRAIDMNVMLVAADQSGEVDEDLLQPAVGRRARLRYLLRQHPRRPQHCRLSGRHRPPTPGLCRGTGGCLDQRRPSSRLRRARGRTRACRAHRHRGGAVQLPRGLRGRAQAARS